jgi:HEAT repeat protein
VVRRWAGPEAVAKLTPLLKSPDAVLRGAACDLLGELRDPRAAGPLVECLAAGTAPAAAAALRVIGRPAEPAVRPLLKHANPSVRLAACQVLQAVGGPDSADDLSAAIADDDVQVRQAAAAAFGAVTGRK